MSKQEIISGNGYNNDNSTIANGGDVQTGFSTVTPAQLAADNGPVKVPGPRNGDAGEDRNVGVTHFVSGANHATMVPGAYVGKVFTTDLIAGTTTNPLAIGGLAATTVTRSIKWSSGVYTTDYVDWSYVSGVVTSSTDQADFFGEDYEATVTRAAPGRFTYLETGGTPTNDIYDAKTDG